MKSITFISMLLLSAVNVIGSEKYFEIDNPNLGSIQLSGTIDDKSFKESGVEIFVYDNYFKYRRELDARQFKISSRPHNSALQIDSVQKFTYVRIDEPKTLPVEFRQSWLFVMPNDSIHIKINDDKLYVSGRGADRIKCLWEIHGYDWKYLSENFPKNKSDIQKSIDTASGKELEDLYYAQYDLAFRKVDYLYGLKIEVLKKYRKVLSQEEIDFIDLECRVWRDYEKLHIWIETPIHEPEQLIARNKILRKEILKWKNKISKPVFAKRSLILADLTTQKEALAFRDANPKHSSLQDFLARIKQKYKGVLYERVLVSLVSSMKYMPYFRDQLDFEKLLILSSEITDPAYKKIIKGYIDLTQDNLNLDIQSFKDTSGNSVKISDFKGKFIVVDFWFTGCTNCVILNKSMEPIIERYRHHPDIIFLSVNMDKSESIWKKSLQRGVRNLGFYTSDESINVSCYPDGFQHSLIKSMNITGAPQQLIVGKNGEVLEFNPPRPDYRNPQSITRFKEIIDKYVYEN